MSKPTDQEIEHVARAMCAARGTPTDEVVKPDSGGDYLRWEDFREMATDFLAGYRAMQEWQ